ncbi:MAG: hypothetical protein M0D53_12755 [Flavobacterium sp. JAD_PAG50586_2]|nr:MAG: hypothetical protein M0D53_12755 [Flavobacterium sp. JAD_PAG50586_2]
MLELSQKFKALETSLKDSKIEIETSRLKRLEDYDKGIRAIEFEYNNLNTEFNYRFPESFKDMLNLDTFYFYGSIEIDGYFSHLEVSIELVSTLLRLLDFDNKLCFDGQSGEEIALWKTFRLLDTRPEIGDGKMAVFSLKDGVSPPNEPDIYYIDRAEAYKTNLTFVQYYEAVLDMLGIAYWQYLFTDVSFKDPMLDHIYPELKASLEALQKALPQKDYSRYFELLEARLNKSIKK